jgi:hypothetical protein
VKNVCDSGRSHGAGGAGNVQNAETRCGSCGNGYLFLLTEDSVPGNVGVTSLVTVSGRSAFCLLHR